MISLALGYLEAAVELFSKNESCHEVCQSDVAKADPAVGAGADFGTYAVAAADDDLKRAAAFFDVGRKIRRKFFRSNILAAQVHDPDHFTGFYV